MAYQSLYRRYRPRGFSDVVGQQHIVGALRNAVRDGRTSHAYLFSGPRGTGKTSSARILAKALNCTDLDDGDPCSACDSCLAIESGTSYDLHELDAASHNGVEAMRDLISKAALGSPGRTKVYILDEVHMLSTAASNALLKTLEEPPDHVTFVLATTDPQKVLPTIRSRTQQFVFGLIPANELADHVRFVIEDAELGLGDDAVDHVVRAGGGSARDTLSALDQVAAAGGVASGDESLDQLMDAVIARDAGLAVSAIATAVAAGRDPRVLGESLLARLRDTFLSAMSAPLPHLQDREHERVSADAKALGPAAVTRGLEAVGEALIEMRQAPDPRIPLEVALVRLSRPESDRSLDALISRIEELEVRVAAGPVAVAQVASAPTAESPTAVAAPSATPAPAAAQAPVEPQPGVGIGQGPAAMARARLAEAIGRTGASPPRPAEPVAETVPAAAPPTPEPAPAAPVAEQAAVTPAAAGGGLPSLSELEIAWQESVLDGLPPRAKALLRAGRFVRAESDAAVFGLPNDAHRARCEEVLADFESGLRDHFARSVPVRLIVDPDGEGGGSAPAAGPPASAPPVDLPRADAGPPPPYRAAVDAALPDGADEVGVGQGSEPVDAAPPTNVVPLHREVDPPSNGRAPAEAPPLDTTDDIDDEDDIGNVHELEDATGVATTIVDQLTEAFPGAELIEGS